MKKAVQGIRYCASDVSACNTKNNPDVDMCYFFII